MSVFIQHSEHNRQLLGSMEIYGMMFHGATGNEYGTKCSYIRIHLLKDSLEIPLMCDENYPNLIVKSNVFAIENIQKLFPGVRQEEPSLYDESTLRKLWENVQMAQIDFELYGKLEGVERLILQSQAIVKTIPGNHPRLHGVLCNLGLLLLFRFQRLGQLVDINEAVDVLRRAINLVPAGHPHIHIYLTRLGGSLHRRFERLGNLADIDDAIVQQQAAVHLTPDGHPDKPMNFSNLGSSLQRRFERHGNLADLDDSIAQHQAAVDLTPDAHPSKPMYLSNLGISLRTRFERFGNPPDIDDAISRSQAAANLIPDDYPNKSVCLNNLGSYLLTRFQSRGNLADLDDAITQTKAGVHLTPDDHPDKPMYLSNLGISLRARFERLGNLADLDDAITQNRAAAHLIPDSHPGKAASLSNLGYSLRMRFARLGNLADLNDGIAQNQAAAHLIPDGHPEKPVYLSNLGAVFQIRFEQLGKFADLDHAIAQHRAAVHLTPDGHPSKPGRFNNLGNSILARFKCFGRVDDLNDGNAQLQAAVHLTPDGHPKKSMYLGNLGNSLIYRFEQFRNLDDINNATARYQTAVDLTPDSHPEKSDCLINLAGSLLARFDLLHRLEDAEMAIRHLSIAATDLVGLPSYRFKAARGWISIASRLEHISLLNAYECALELIPLVAWLGLPIVGRHQYLAQIGGMAREAASAAISLEQYGKALEWLEQGRSIVWTQILQLRTPVDQLREVNSDLADRLVQVSRTLEQGSGQGGISEEVAQSMEEQGRRYRALTMEWESIIDQVRSLPNFENFLRPPSSDHLLNAARNGPVIVLNVATNRCDALAILPGLDDIVHIPLPNITSKRVTELRDDLKDFLYSTGNRSRGERAAMKIIEEADEQTCQRVLAELWNNLVKPILSSLAFSVRPYHGHTSKHTNCIMSSLIRMYFPASGGALPDHWPSCLFTRLAYTMENR
jgi:tetratricopeptide (TPR) repeat protein